MPQRETAFDNRCFPLFILFKPSCLCLKKPIQISARSASNPPDSLAAIQSVCESTLTKNINPKEIIIVKNVVSFFIASTSIHIKSSVI